MRVFPPRFRPVSVDLPDVQRLLSDSHRREVTDIEAVLWLRDVGFVPFSDGGWVADDCALTAVESLRAGSADS
jgi:hypothetical protein